MPSEISGCLNSIMPAKRTKKPEKSAKHVTASSLDSKVYAACDIMRRSNCSGAMNYIPELSWILFLRILDELETQEEARAKVLRLPFSPCLESPYRWRDWAAPSGAKRIALTEGGVNEFKAWVNDELIPFIKTRRFMDGASSRQKVVSEILSGVERVRIDTDKNLLDVLDKIDGIRQDAIDETHVFTLSQVYEGLLADLGEKAGDGGQFFTPREIIRAVVKTIDPQVGQRVYDPSCGTGGFLAQAFEHMRGKAGKSAKDLEFLKQETFFGREKENLIYPIALSNLVLHGIDFPHLWHGNSLTGEALYDGLWEGAPEKFDVILSNPPFGGKEGKEAQSGFAFQTKATQILFLQHVIDTLEDGGKCGIVLDEGVLFRTTEDAFIKTKRKLLEECDLWCIVSLPGGAFSGAGAGVKTNLLFFTKGKPTEKVWYYDFSDIKVGKKTPFTLERFDDFFKLLPKRGDSERSWTVDIADRREKAAADAEPFQKDADNARAKIAALKDEKKEARKIDDSRVVEIEEEIAELLAAAREADNRAEAIHDTVYDLKAVNPSAASATDARSLPELLAVIEAEGQKISNLLANLR